MTPQRIPRPFRVRRDGMTLLLALAIIALISISVMAFFSQVTSNRMVETSRSKRTEVDLFARSACDYVKGVFLQEITNATNSTLSSTNGVTIYTPKSNAAILPQRALSAAISTSDTNYFNLIRQSVPSGDSNASADSTMASSKNGRLISAARWNFPVLLSGSGFTSQAQLPNWIYLTGSGVTNAASAQSIGRFSYNVYDIGGLLNANVAGHPSTLTAQQVALFKTSVAGADLTQLGMIPGDIDKLIAFRNPAATTAPTYISSIASTQSANGFLCTVTASASVTSTNNYFNSRQDLLKFAKTQATGFVNALPSLTHFSRSLNAPSCSPVNPPNSTMDYAANAEIIGSSNRNIPNVRFAAATTGTHYADDGSSFTYAVQAGDPLIQYRFSLAKIAWLTPSGPASTALVDPIQKCFGLKWNSSNDRWEYYGSLGTSAASSVETLDVVASENREPNFFELLKAGILSKSLGLAAPGTTLAQSGQQLLEAAKDLQILQIGANIIDCADSDNYPTIIALNVGGTLLEIAGVEDLPYFHSLWITGLQKWDLSIPSNPRIAKCDVVGIPVFINPHRTPASAPISGPASVTMDIPYGSLTSVGDNNGNYTMNKNKSLAGLSSITIPQTAGSGMNLGFEDFRNGPQAMLNSNASNCLKALVPYVTTDNDKQGILIFSYQTEYDKTWPAPAPSSTTSGATNPITHDPPYLSLNLRGTIFRLQYPAPSGRMKTYTTLAGNESLASTSGLLPSYLTFGVGFNFKTPTDSTTLNSGSRIILWDPRTNRLGPSADGYPAPCALPAFSGATDRIFASSPFSESNATDKTNYPCYPAIWPQGGKSRDLTSTKGQPGWFTNMADPDGVYRPADGWLGNAANPYRQVSGTVLNAADASRPVLLQRPYKSVAELGYVFRGDPWKSLSFSDETSGDSMLLDLFSVADEPAVTAARVNLNTRQTLVRQALFTQTVKESDGTSSLASASTLASAYEGYSFSSGSATSTMPSNISQLANFMFSGSNATTGTTPIPAASIPIKYQREGVVRSIADATQTRTWNLLIDVIAQCGHGANASNFVVDGEQRYWLSIAIDRYTGKIVDQQLESVNE